MRVAILLALIGVAVAVPPRDQSRIVGGSPTTIQNFPYMSNMQYNWWGSIWYQACGGTLITSTAVLSAAHCYEGDRAASWRVRLGTSFASSGGNVHTVSRITIHGSYSSRTLDNDIAILRLSSAAVLSNSIQVASIAGPNYNVADGAVVTAIGWGTLSSGGQSPEQLQSVQINVINQALCAQRYAYLKSLPGYSGWPDITARMLCAGILNVGGKDACQGDSGGPLAHNGNVLVGVVSWGFGCADPFYPGVNARVSQFTNWIQTNAV